MRSSQWRPRFPFYTDLFLMYGMILLIGFELIYCTVDLFP
jgi:hypothetical protein